MSMTSVVCNVPVLSQNDSTSFCLHDMKVTSLRYLDAKFHHPSLGASPPNRGNRISCVQNSRKTENRNSVNNSGIGILCSKNSNERLAFPAVAGLLVINNSIIKEDIIFLLIFPPFCNKWYVTERNVFTI